MNHLLKTLMLAAILFFAGSFKSSIPDNTAHYKNDGYFMASIDGQIFDSRNQDRYTAEIINNVSGDKVTPGADLIFYGNDYFDQSGNLFQESLEFKYAFNESSTGDVTGQKIVFQFNNQKFLSIPGETKIHVTKMRFNTDRSAFVMSADFEGKMLKWVAPGEDQSIITVKGKMENINVSVPASVKTATRIAS